METATENSSVVVNDYPSDSRGGMTESEWKAATKFDSTDAGWIIMSIGMAIGAGRADGFMGILTLIHYWLSSDVFVSALIH